MYLDALEELTGVRAVLKELPVKTILLSLLMLTVGIVLVRLILHILDKLFKKTQLDSSLHRFLKSLIGFLLYLALILMVTSYLGINITSLVTLLSAVSLAISLSVQNVLSNVAGGIMVMGSKPFCQGDYVSIDGEEGTVDEITTVYTKFHTIDNRSVLMPNAKVSQATIVNFSALGKRRLEQTFTASYDSDPEKVMAALRKAAERCQPLEGEPLVVEFHDFGDSAIGYHVHLWVPSSRFVQSRFDLRRYVWEEFKAAGVEMTYPHLNVHMKS